MRHTCALAVMISYSLAGAQSEAVLDETVKPVIFESLAYPLAARLTHTQGVVVIQVELDDAGRVTTSTALSGAKVLIAECLSNAKKWRFQSNVRHIALIVYLFKIEGLCSLPCSSQFSFHPPNLVIVRTGDPVVDHAAQ